MEHAHLERISPKGEAGRWQCLDCEEIGTLTILSNSACNADIKTPKDAALMNALGNEKN